MRFMNYYDIDRAERRYGNGTPNRARLARTISNLAAWANSNSDGWAYWPKPARAAARAMVLVDPTTNEDERRLEATDATDAETRAALSPIKAFLTKQGVAHDAIIPEGTQTNLWG